MKHYLCLISCILFISSSQAQWFSKTIKGEGPLQKEHRETPEYDQIAVSGFFDVELYHGKEGQIEITAEKNLLPYITIEVNKNKLSLGTKEGYSLETSKGVQIRVPFESITSIALAGSGDIISTAPIVAEKFSTKLVGSGDITLELDTRETESLILGSGDITLIGTSQTVNHKITGSGDIDAYKLIATDAKAAISGSGDISLYCQGSLVVNISGSGDVYYKGKPTKEVSKIVGSGDLHQR